MSEREEPRADREVDILLGMLIGMILALVGVHFLK